MARAEYVEIECKSALNRVRGMPFKWSLNPYVGCVHACQYCYARAYYELAEHGSAGRDFESRILVKRNFPEVLRHELGRRSWVGEAAALGTATDPYQPAEGRFRITRRVLESLRDFRNPLSMVTKSPLVFRDLDILADLSAMVDVRVYFTLTTVDTALWRKVEPGTANPWKRLAVMGRLREAGIPAGVIMAPILPGITDSVVSIDAVVSAAAAHGAAFFTSGPLRLGPSVREHYLDFIDRSYPELRARYERAYGQLQAPMEYREKLEQRLQRIREAHGLAKDSSRGQPLSADASHHDPRQAQLPLWHDSSRPRPSV